MSGRPVSDVFSRYASGVTVVTCRNANGQPHGATVTAFAAVSHTPYLCQVAMAKRSRACQFLDRQPFAVNFLGSEQMPVAMHFAGRPVDPAPTLVEGRVAPVLTTALATVSCRPWATYDAGDHLIFIGEIIDAQVAEGDPLLYYRRGFHGLSSLSQSDAWSGCSDDPLTGWFDENASFIPAHTLPVSSPIA
ncbi:flavin reductase family protein [Mycolicibacterium wolinskyi]|uniref:Flavin reductase n=1 Tax=Mycolicibacterium wolinskyi TaxID=59750 RepID=A0A1X2F5E5_9MYCO|nr:MULTISPECIES: flavin reductase family protein [Mycolicibacterium]MCV7289783.1 flavin reductase family protein [Mycolicibacterium wolinskyi]MCV7296380.1 flavin reductase family protein [Mycolicibacterium goodii]ORX13637.1 flavin reductase [Mycolicibacterium wolinskyi]